MIKRERKNEKSTKSEAKDKNTEEIPSEMLLNGIKVTTDEIEEVFAEFF